MQPMNRRQFMERSASLVALSGVSLATLAAGEPTGSVRLGGPVFASDQDPETLARAHRRLGYGAAYCPNVPLADSARIRAYEEAFQREGVIIAEVGRWVNLMDANADKRRENLKLVTEGLALADEIGALCCVDIAGSMNPEVWYGPHPDNVSDAFFEAAVENARKIIDAVKPQRAKFCYEMMGWAIPDSASSCLRLLQAVDRTQFGVHLDPCNLINSPEKFHGNTQLLEQCFDLLGSHVVSCHAKDLRWEVEMNVHFREVIPGTGSLDYRTYLRCLSRLPQRPPLMLEHLASEEEYARARQHVVQVGEAEGIKFL